MAATSGGQIVWNLDVDSSKFDTGVASADAKAAALSSSLGSIDFSKYADKATAAFNGVADSIGAVLKVTTLATAAGVVLGGAFIASAAGLQTASSSMQVLVGNTEQANRLFGQLATYANSTPFTFPQVASAGKILLGFGVSADQLLTRVKNLGDIASVTGADFNTLATVFGQVTQAGRLQGQNFLQLTNAGIPISQMLKNVGVDTKNLDKIFQSGGISLDTFTQAFNNASLAGGFAFQGTDKLAQTLSGRLSTLSDTALEFGRNLIGVHVDPQLGLVIQPGGVFDRLSNYIQQLITELPTIEPAFQRGFNFILANGRTIVDIFASLVAAFIAVKVAAGLVSFASFISTAGGALVAIRGLIAGTATLDAVLAANPFGLIAVVLAGVAAGVTFLQLKFDIFGKALGFVRGAVGALVPVFTGLVDAARLLFTGDFTGKGLFGVEEDSTLVAVLLSIREGLLATYNVAATVGSAISGAVVTGFAAIVRGARTLVSSGLSVVLSAITATANAFHAAQRFFDEHRRGLEQIEGVITVLVGPALLKLGVTASVAGARMAAAAAVSAAQWVVQATNAGAAWAAAYARMVAGAIVTGVRFATQAIKGGAVWAAQAVIAGAAWVAQFVRMAAQGAVVAAAYVGQAALALGTWLVSFAVMSARATVTATVFAAQATIGGYAWAFRAGLASAAWIASFALMFARAVVAAPALAAQGLIAAAGWIAAAAQTSAAWLAAFASMIARGVVAAPAVAAEAVTVAAAWVVQAAVMSAAWIAAFVAMIAESVVAATVMSANALRSAAGWVVQAAVMSGAWLVAFGLMVAEGAVAAAGILADAAVVGVAWLIALGPIGLVIAAITAIAVGAFLIIKNWGAVQGFFLGIFSAIGRAVNEFLGSVVSIGTNIVAGIVAGLANGAGAVVQKIKDICGAALNAVKSFFGIHSPSTVMASMGGFLMLGLAQGIDGSAGLATDAMSSASSSLQGAVGGISATSGQSLAQNVSSGSSAGLTGGCGGGDVHLTVNLGAYTGEAAETRNLGVKIYAELQRVARSNGTQLPDLAVRT